MSTITKPNTFSASATIIASEHNDNFDTIYNDYNGGITNANISPSAAIADTKLAQLTTTNKVALSALTAAGTYTPTGDWDFSSANAFTLLDSCVTPGKVANVLGSWGSATVGSSTQVSFDSLLVGYYTEDPSGTSTFTIKTDSSNPPTTVRVQITRANSSKINLFICPVKKSDYYLIEVANGTVTNADIIPIGT